MAETPKPKRNFDRNYSGTKVVLTNNDDPVLEYEVTSIHGAKTIEGSALKGLARYTSDIIVGVGNAALKVEGATLDDAVTKMTETLSAFQKGEFAFRAASGSSEDLSDDEIKEVIAKTLVAMGKLPTIEAATALVERVYSVTKKNAKGYDQRPDFLDLKRIPAIKEALTKAAKIDSGAKVDSVLSKFADKPADEAAAA